MKTPTTTFQVTDASPHHTDGILSCLRSNADDRSLAQHPRWYIQRSIQDFLVAENDDGAVVGCLKLMDYGRGVVEIMAVSVHPQQQGLGVGGALVRYGLERARGRSPRILWLATEKPDYFSRFGFERFSKWELPLMVLMSKVRVVFRQSPSRWWPMLTGTPVFMRDRTG